MTNLLLNVSRNYWYRVVRVAVMTIGIFAVVFPTWACQPPMPGSRWPTQEEAVNSNTARATAIVVARATNRGDNGKANPTGYDGKAWADISLKHIIKGKAPSRVVYPLEGCSWPGKWNQHIPLDRDTLLFLSNDYVIDGYILAPDGNSKKQAEQILERAKKFAESPTVQGK